MMRTSCLLASIAGLLLAAPSPAAPTFPTNNPAFYGAPIGIDTLYNTHVGGPNGWKTSYRFRSDHAGALQAVRLYLKHGSGYAAGTGGAVRIQLQTDDGTSNHFPSGKTLATLTYAPPTASFPLLTFSIPGQLQSGQLYHLVFTNTDPNPAANYVSVNAIHIQQPGAQVHPGIKDADYAQLISGPTGPWSVRTGFTPVLELDYADGYSTGMGYMESWINFPHLISGAQSARQLMTITGSDRAARRVSFRMKRVSGSDPLTVRIERADGTIVEQGQIPASAFSTTSNWVGYAFSATRTLSSGQAYRVVLTAPSSSSYSIYPIRQGGGQGFKPTTAFMDGYADYNGGSGWYGGWDPWGSRNLAGVLQFYFDVGAAAPPPDTTPPSVAIAAPAAGAVVSGSVSVAATAADNVGVAGVQFLLDGAALGAEVVNAPFTAAWNAASAPSGFHVLTAVARDAAGNKTTSAPVSVSVAPAVPAGCLASSPAWKGAAFPSQAAAFNATFDAVPLAAKIDGVTGLSLGAASGYASLAAAVRFNNAGYLDARNGAAYAAAAAIPYAPGVKYRIRLLVNPASRRYSVFVTPPGAAEKALGTDYSFRTEQAGISSLSDWALYASSGSHHVCAFALAPAADVVAPVVAITAPAAGATVTGTLTVSAAASDDKGVAGVQFLLDGAKLSAEELNAPYTATWNTAGSAAGAHTLTAVARDAAGNKTTSAPVTVSVAAACLTSSTAWRNRSFAAQSAAFTASFDATPSAAKIDALTGMSRGGASGYASLAVAVRFNNAGFLDARNGSVYAAAASVAYAAGAKYRFRLAVNPATRRYSVWVTPPGKPEVALAANYAFRTEQAAAASLDHWAVYAGVGSHQACAFAP